MVVYIDVISFNLSYFLLQYHFIPEDGAAPLWKEGWLFPLLPIFWGKTNLKKDTLIFLKHFFRGHKFVNDLKHVDEILNFR